MVKRTQYNRELRRRIASEVTGARAFRDRKTFAQLQHEQGVTGLFDVAELYDAESPEEELEAYDAALQRLAEL